MKGIAVREGQLRLVNDLVRPVPGHGEVEVEVVCASVNPTDLELAAGVYDELLASQGKLASTRTGLELSGVVVGQGQRFAHGDEVFGYVDLMNGEKSHQERVVINEALIAKKPEGWSFAEAAAVPLGAQTSLVALRDVAQARAGEKVLVNGASGGLGVYAVQIAARMLDLHVTAVASGKQAELMRRLGAHEVLDYNTTDVLGSRETYDIIFDLTTKMQFEGIEHLLSSTGRFMPSEPLKAGVDFSPGARSGERSVSLWVEKGDGQILAQVADWVSSGQLEILVDSVHPLTAFERAFARIRESGKQGRVILNVGGE